MSWQGSSPPRAFRWKTGDGRKLTLSEMTDSHLCNTIRYLVRVDHQDSEAFHAMTQEAKARGLKWKPKGKCKFVVEDGKCNEPATILTAANSVRGNIPQQGRCDKHRPDAIRFNKVPCSGCLKDDVELVFAIDSGDMFCATCSTPVGPLATFLYILMVILTLGIRR